MRSRRSDSERPPPNAITTAPYPRPSVADRQHADAQWKTTRGTGRCARRCRSRRLPGHEGTEWHRKQERNKERREGQIKKWRTDGNFITGHGLECQRIKCANKNGETGSCQEEVVEDESGLARDRSEQTALL